MGWSLEKVEAKAPGRQGLQESPLGGKGKSKEHMGSTKKNESENKISHKGQHLPTKDDTYKIYTQREH